MLFCINNKRSKNKLNLGNVFIEKEGKQIIDKYTKNSNDEHEFKPILVEIESIPASPTGRLFMWIIVSLIFIVVLALIFVSVDVVVTARGKIIPFGDMKVVQPLETGVLTNVNVKEGDFIKKGDVLMEMDTAIEVAELKGKEKNFDLLKLSKNRINAVLNNKEFNPSNTNKEYFNENIDSQQRLYDTQMSVYIFGLKEKQKQLEGVDSIIKATEQEIKNLKEILNISSDEERRLQKLVEIGAVSDNKYTEKIKERLGIEKEIETVQGRLQEQRSQFNRIIEEVEGFKSQFKEKLLEELLNNLQQKNALLSEVSSIKFKQDKRLIVSPVNGYVHLINIKTLGGVVTPAQPLISIVPENAELIVKGLVFNKDIGFIKKEQKVIVKIDTFDFQKYGTIEGRIDTISPFSIENKSNDEQNKLTDDQSIGPGQSIDGYIVYIKFNSQYLKDKSGKQYQIKSGMSVTAEINIGKRRLIEFVLFPMIKYLDEGVKVR